jgi:hypothetical protein
LQEILQEDIMIRLSCWIGAMGCGVTGKALRKSGEGTVVQVGQASLVDCRPTAEGQRAREIDSLAFPNVAPGLLDFFHAGDAEADCAATLDEILFGRERREDGGARRRRAGRSMPAPSGSPARGAEAVRDALVG